MFLAISMSLVIHASNDGTDSPGLLDGGRTTRKGITENTRKISTYGL